MSEAQLTLRRLKLRDLTWLDVTEELNCMIKKNKSGGASLRSLSAALQKSRILLLTRLRYEIKTKDDFLKAGGYARDPG